MAKPPTTPNLSALLEHGGWVRALARSLVSDAAAAEDVEQVAWLAALEHPPKHASNLKSWLGAVVRNKASMHWREQKARDQREEVVGRNRFVEDSRRDPETRPDSLVERKETFGQIAAALVQMEEPYGSAVYLRYCEELTLREISERTGVSESTVHARIERGLRTLRQQLAADMGENWRIRCLVFTVPLATKTVGGLITVIAMTTKTKLAITAAVLAVASFLAFNPWDSQDTTDIAEGGREGAALASTPVAQALTSFGNPLAPLVRGDVSRVGVGEKDSRVLIFRNKRGQPVANLIIGFRNTNELYLRNAEAPPTDSKVGVTNGAGQVWVRELPEGRTSVITLDSDWFVVGSSALGETTDGVQDFRVVHGGSMVGQVIGPSGPIKDATVEVMVTSFLFSSEKDVDVRSLALDPANHRYAKTDRNGYFRIYGVVQSTSIMIVLADGFSPASPEVQGPQSGDVADLGEIFVEPGVDCSWSFFPLESLGKNARLFLSKKSAFTRGGFGVPLDNEGKARMTGMEPGKYRWVLEQPGQVGVVGSAMIPESGGTVSISLPESRDLRVQVVDSEGQLVPDVLIKARESHGRTMQFRGDGEVFLRCNAEAAVILRVESLGFVTSSSITVPAERNSVSVELLRHGSLQLSFKDVDVPTDVAVGLLQEISAVTNITIKEGISPTSLEDRSGSTSVASSR